MNATNATNKTKGTDPTMGAKSTAEYRQPIMDEMDEVERLTAILEATCQRLDQLGLKIMALPELYGFWRKRAASRIGNRPT